MDSQTKIYDRLMLFTVVYGPEAWSQKVQGEKDLGYGKEVPEH